MSRREQGSDNTSRPRPVSRASTDKESETESEVRARFAANKHFSELRAAATKLETCDRDTTKSSDSDSNLDSEKTQKPFNSRLQYERDIKIKKQRLEYRRKALSSQFSSSEADITDLRRVGLKALSKLSNKYSAMKPRIDTGKGASPPSPIKSQTQSETPKPTNPSSTREFRSEYENPEPTMSQSREETSASSAATTDASSSPSTHVSVEEATMNSPPSSRVQIHENTVLVEGKSTVTEPVRTPPERMDTSTPLAPTGSFTTPRKTTRLGRLVPPPSLLTRNRYQPLESDARTAIEGKVRDLTPKTPSLENKNLSTDINRKSGEKAPAAADVNSPAAETILTLTSVVRSSFFSVLDVALIS